MITYRCMPRTVLRKGSLSIKAVQPEHIERIRQWRNAQMNFLRQVTEIAPEEQKSYYKNHIWSQKDEKQPENILLSYMEEDRLIGYGGLVHIAWVHRRAEVSFLMDPKLAEDANAYYDYFFSFLELIKVLAFDDLRLVRIFTETYALRTRHLAILEASGFVREGVLKKHVAINDQPVDSIIHGCLRDVKVRVDEK